MDLHVRPFTLTLSEPFVISRSADEEAEVVQVAIAHDGVVGYGEAAPDPHYGESVPGAIEFCERAAADLGDDPFAIEAILGRVAARGDQMAARCAIDSALLRPGRQALRAAAVADPRARPRHDPADVVHDQHRHGGGDGRPRPPGRRLPRAEDQGGRPRRPGARAGRPRRGAGRADPRRRQRGLDGRVHARHLPGAGRAQRRADRAAAAGRRRRGVRGAAPDAAADPDRARRELPHAARRRGGVGARRRRQHQADQVGRHPRGAADDPRRPGARPADHARAA